MEIITGIERRRRWRLEDKLRIVAELDRPGASCTEIARRHEVSRGLLWNWRRQVRQGLLAPVPVPEKSPRKDPDRIEIALPDGTCVRIGENVGLAALRRIITAVRR